MSNTTNKKPSPAIVIMKRELATYFTNPISYIVTGLFLIITGVMFFTTFFLQNRANMRNFFSLLPILFSFFIPVFTRSLAVSSSLGAFSSPSKTEQQILSLSKPRTFVKNSKVHAVFSFFLLHHPEHNTCAHDGNHSMY